MRGWFFDHARRLTGQPDSEFAVLHLTIAHFETYAIHARGEDSRRRSEWFFTEGFLDVFTPKDFVPLGGSLASPEAFLKNLAKKLYTSARCGLFHSGLAGEGIWLARAASPITPSVSRTTGEVSVVIIDPELFLGEVEGHFAAYVARLRDPRNTEIRERFEAAWKLKRQSGTVRLPPGGIPPEVLRPHPSPGGR